MELLKNVVNQDVEFLMSQLGRKIKINNKESLGVFSNRDIDYYRQYFGDKNLLTKDLICMGDIVNYNDKKYIVIGCSGDKKFDFYYKARIRKCNYILKVGILQNEKLIVKCYDVFVRSKEFNDTLYKSTIPLSLDEKEIFISLDEFTSHLKKKDRFIMYDTAWQIKGIDRTSDTLMKIIVQEVLFTENDDVEREIANYWVYNKKDLLDIKHSKSLNLKVGQVEQLQVINNSKQKVIYTSSEDNIVTVDSNGTINAISEGTAIISIRLEKHDICKQVSINVAGESKKSIELNSSSSFIPTYGELKIIAKVNPKNEKIKFTFEGSRSKCKLKDIKDNSCVIKADSDVGIITVKAFLQNDETVYDTIRIEVKEEWEF